MAEDEFKIDIKKFEVLFKMCYEQIQSNHANRSKTRERLQKMLKGHIASTSRKINSESYPTLNNDDLETIKTFSKQTIAIMNSMTKQNQDQQQSSTHRKRKQAVSQKSEGELVVPFPSIRKPSKIVTVTSSSSSDETDFECNEASFSIPPAQPVAPVKKSLLTNPKTSVGAVKRKLWEKEDDENKKNYQHSEELATPKLKKVKSPLVKGKRESSQQKILATSTKKTKKSVKKPASIKFSGEEIQKVFFEKHKLKKAAKAEAIKKRVDSINLDTEDECMESEDDSQEMEKLNGEMIDDQEMEEETNQPSFYNRVDKTLPSAQVTRIVGDTKIQNREQIHFQPDFEDENETGEDGGAPLNFRDGEIESGGDEEAESEITKPDNECEELDEGVKMVEMKDGTVKMVTSGDQKDMDASLIKSIRQKLAKTKADEIIDFKLDPDEPKFANLKSNENCFISTIVGCVAMLVYKTHQKSRFEKGEIIDKVDLDKLGILDYPYRIIKSLGPSTIGVEGLPDRMFEKDYIFPSIDEDNIADKLTQIEAELNNHGVNISFNLYLMAEDRVHTKVVSGDKVTSVNRLTSSVIIVQQSKINKPRHHNTSFNIVLTEEGEGTQFHCAAVLNVGKFIYHNDERFFYEKGADKLANIINTTNACLTGGYLDGDEKVSTAKSRRVKYAAKSWQTVHNCNACMTGFLKKERFENHIMSCVGGHVSSMVFNTIPHIEHFESKEFASTLLCPIVASFDTEACASKDITRRIGKDGIIYKSDAQKEAKMILCAVVATVIVRPKRSNDYTFYKDTSMDDEEMMDYTTIPFTIRRHVEVEDIVNLSQSLEYFRTSMNAFMELKLRIINMHMEKSENPAMKQQAKEELNATSALLTKRRSEASKRFGVFYMQFFQIIMEATKKEVAVRAKKTLKMSWRDRSKFIEDTTISKCDIVFEDGVLYVIEKPKEGDETLPHKIAITTENSVTVGKYLNCVICNQKMDPIYLRHLKSYYDAKITAGKGNNKGICGHAKDTDDVYEDSEDDDDYQMMIGDEIVRLSRTVNTSEGNEDVHKPKSPHVNIWRGRNMWQVKEKLLMMFFSQINRLKQELLVTAHRDKKEHLSKNPDLESIQAIDAEMAKMLEDRAYEKVISDYKISNADQFVLSIMWDEWRFTEPYTANDREQLIDCLYQFVESLATLEQFIKVFDKDCVPITLQKKNAGEFANQDAVKSYFSKNSAAEDEHEETGKQYRTRLDPMSNKKNRVFWFVNENEYEQLGENVLRLVSLLFDGETYSQENYTPETIYERIREIKVKNNFKSVGEVSQEELQADFFKQRVEVLKHRLFHAFVRMYPKFEFELRFFFQDQVVGEYNLARMINIYLDSIVVHHHHYFPEMDPIGHAHESCNIVTYTKGVPTPHIFVHNLTNYDSDFILKMIPPDVMAHKGKNTERQWSVISPDGNKHKIKLLMTPFGTFSDSMNFFASSLATMASQMNERDIEQLFELHLSYFQRSKRFKHVLERREREGRPFDLDFFKNNFKGKLIFPYEDMNDIDWVHKPSDKLPHIEVFMQNKLGKKEITAEQYINMSNIYDYFECKNMSDLLHIYTLEDGMLLAIIMSNTFQDMYEALGLDPTNFTSTAKYSYIACKRLMNLNMQTIPNGRVFNCIADMKRAGFAMVKKQVSIASPLNAHIQECQYSPDCEKCAPFVKRS
ncbi:uncharacterized protein [Clytia hemisphaerica]